MTRAKNCQTLHNKKIFDTILQEILNTAGRDMTGAERRTKITEILTSSKEAVSATKLAAEFGVTRQIIVSDIALLRAEGNPVAAERRGYYLKKAEGIYKTVICRHDVKGAAEEFNAIVDNGGKVLNVIVEHPLYGNISAELNVTSRYDAEEFVRKTEESNASFLSDLTGGLHIHTISVPDEKSYERIVAKQRALDIIAEEGSVGE